MTKRGPAGSAFALAGLRGSDWSAVGRLFAEVPTVSGRRPPDSRVSSGSRQ